MEGGLLSIDLSLSSFIFERKRYFSAVFSDISQKKKSLERNKFLAFLSHEIRNPLQVSAPPVARRAAGQPRSFCRSEHRVFDSYRIPFRRNSGHHFWVASAAIRVEGGGSGRVWRLRHEYDDDYAPSHKHHAPRGTSRSPHWT
jgi:hypothetical protein